LLLLLRPRFLLLLLLLVAHHNLVRRLLLLRRTLRRLMVRKLVIMLASIQKFVSSVHSVGSLPKPASNVNCVKQVDSVTLSVKNVQIVPSGSIVQESMTMVQTQQPRTACCVLMDIQVWSKELLAARRYLQARTTCTKMDRYISANQDLLVPVLTTIVNHACQGRTHQALAPFHVLLVLRANLVHSTVLSHANRAHMAFSNRHLETTIAYKLKKVKLLLLVVLRQSQYLSAQRFVLM
jgi:hypothetical protein